MSPIKEVFVRQVRDHTISRKFKINLYGMIKDQGKIKEKMYLKGKVGQGINAII